MARRPQVAPFAHDYRPTLLEVLAAVAGAIEYEAQRQAIEVELFGYADGEEWLMAA